MGERASALRGRFGALLWLYALVPVPLLTAWLENTPRPDTSRGRIAEIAARPIPVWLRTGARRAGRATHQPVARVCHAGPANRYPLAPRIR